MEPDAIRKTRQGRRQRPERPETGRATGANRVGVSAWKTRDTRNQEGQPMAEEEYTGQRDVAQEERDVTRTETAGNTELGAAASNDSSDSAQLCNITPVDHYGAGDGS